MFRRTRRDDEFGEGNRSRVLFPSLSLSLFVSSFEVKRESLTVRLNRKIDIALDFARRRRRRGRDSASRIVEREGGGGWSCRRKFTVERCNVDYINLGLIGKYFWRDDVTSIFVLIKVRLSRICSW